jgi:hypothetical protein
LQVFWPLHESGSCAFVIVVHVPFEPGTLHAWQVPHATDEQHTPSTQFPLAH